MSNAPQPRFAGRVAALGVALLLACPALAVADHAFLGITSRSVTGEDARERGLDSRDGAIVQKVYRGTAAEKAGLKRDDIIVELGGEKVFDDQELTDMIRSHDVGESVSIGILRDGKPMTLKATLGSASDFQEDGDGGGWVSALESFLGGRHGDGPTLGVHVMELNSQLAEYFEVQENRGLLVTQVMRRTPAEAAGIRAGDVVTRVGGSRIYGSGDITDALAERWGEPVTVEVVRKGKPLEIQVKLEEE